MGEDVGCEKEETRPSEIAMELSDLDIAIENHKNTLLRLKNILKPVLANIPQTIKESDNVKQPECTTELGKRLRTSTNIIKSNSRDLGILIDLIQL